MSRKRILVVDDEEAIAWALRKALEGEGYQVVVAANARQAFEAADKDSIDAIVLDVRLPDADGLTVLEQLRKQTKNAPVIVITAYGNLSTAVRAVEGGAFDYLAKPFDLHQALEAVARALQPPARPSPAATPTVSGPAGEEQVPPDEIVGHSPVMQTVFKRIALVAPRDASVLITGESGTGKELVARAIHRHSARREQPFLPVHLAALSPTLVESELFGHMKGAFTGAAQTRPGLLSLADGGTVFLDELADIPLPVQVKLLRVLEHNEIMPVGSNHSRTLNIRILGATHQDLSRKVADGSFRHDLFFRLNVFQIHLPPLRERVEDIVPLAEHFLRRFAPGSMPLRSETVRYLESQPWLGNVRELRNALEHAAIVARESAILPEHFPQPAAGIGPLNAAQQLDLAVRRWLAERVASAGTKPPANLYEELLHAVEPALLEDLMRRVQNNRWEAARWLGLNRATVRKKLALYRLADAAPAEEEPDESET